MPDSHRIKAGLRKSLRQRRGALSTTEQRAAAQSLVDPVIQLPPWSSAKCIAIYRANDGEIDTGPLETIARSLGKQIYLPTITEDDSLEFACWDTDDTLTKNRYHIPEPPASAARCSPSQLDIVFLPLVGWDLFGVRLGMGGGYYDRALANAAGPLLVGLAHECQRVEEVPRQSWDIVLDFIATDVALYRGKS
jgi:5-formyltetrahydrofolate cyclo-ligase